MNDNARNEEPTDDGDERELFDDLEELSDDLSDDGDLPEPEVGEELDFDLASADALEPVAEIADDAAVPVENASQSKMDSMEEADFLEEISFDELDVDLTADAGQAIADADAGMPLGEFETVPEFVDDAAGPVESSGEGMPAEIDFGAEEISLAEGDSAHDDAPAVTEIADDESTPTSSAGAPGTEKPFEFENRAGAEVSSADRIQMTVAPVIPAKRNILVDLAKVVVGALVGLAIAQGILWWVFSLDPLGLAGKLPNGLAWAAPSKMRKMAAIAAKQNVARTSPIPDPADDDELEDDSAGDADVDSGPDAAAAAGTPEPGIEAPPDDTLAGAMADDLANTAADSPPVNNVVDTPPATVPATVPATEEESDPDLSDDLDEMLAETADTETPSEAEAGPAGSGTTAEAGPTADPAADSDDRADASTATLLDDDQPLLPEEDILGDLMGTEPEASTGWGPVGAPKVTRNDLAGAIAVARTADERLDEAQLNSDPELRQAAKDFYRAFADLAEKATHVNRDGADPVLESSRQLISAFEFDDKKQRLIGNAAGGWIRNDLGDGILAGGSVAELQSGGELTQFQLNLFGKSGRSVTVVTQLNPDSNQISRFENGDRVLLLGVVVRDPAKNLRGYTGSAEKVVWLTDQLVRIP